MERKQNKRDNYYDDDYDNDDYDDNSNNNKNSYDDDYDDYNDDFPTMDELDDHFRSWDIYNKRLHELLQDFKSEKFKENKNIVKREIEKLFCEYVDIESQFDNKLITLDTKYINRCIKGYYNDNDNGIEICYSKRRFKKKDGWKMKIDKQVIVNGKTMIDTYSRQRQRKEKEKRKEDKTEDNKKQK